MGFGNPLVWIYMIGLILSLFFVYRYARYSDWRSTLAGRAVMNLSASISLTLGYAVFARLLPLSLLSREIAGIILLTIVDVALFNLSRVLVQTQGGFRRGQAEGTTSDRSVKQS